MHTSPKARLIFRLRKLLFVLPIALPGGAVLCARLSARLFGNTLRIPWLLIPTGIAAFWWLILTIFVSARAAVRVLHIRQRSRKVMAIPAMILGVLIFAGYLLLTRAFVGLLDLLFHSRLI